MKGRPKGKQNDKNKTHHDSRSRYGQGHLKIEANLTKLNRIEVTPGGSRVGILEERSAELLLGSNNPFFPRSSRRGSHFRVPRWNRSGFARIRDAQVLGFGNFWAFFEVFAMKKKQSLPGSA